MKYLLIVGVLLLASAAPLWAEPTNVPSANWFAPSCAAAPATRTGFLLPTLAVSTPSAVPRLIVTETALLGALPVTLTHTAGQAQQASKPQKSWFARNWWWVVPVAALLTAGAVCAAQECMA